ncbi:MAG TPA: conserved phage C-terminal domain-containing protein [Candidatus Udaeobacter sp.]|nr:conserved phage C-terminal domain-containing protein [Candidatus Udaeobacter sp.]
MDWFRLYAEFATDPKVQMMDEAMQRRLIMLFCLQCSNGIETFHETERETSIAFALRISEQELAETKALFLRKQFINSDWTLRNWSKRQYVSDSSTARVRKHREAKKHADETHETLPKRSSNALEQNRTDTDKETTLSGKPDDETRVPQPVHTAEAKEAIAYLNEKTGSAYRDVPTNLRMIGARFAEGYTLDEVKAVIDAKCAEWSGNPEMAKFLRPMTLFRPSNFSNYAGQTSPPSAGWWTPLGFASAYDAENAGFNQHSKREAMA